MRFPVPPVAVAFCGLAALFLAVPVPSQDAPAPEPAVVSILGASVSAGFVDPKPRENGEPNSTVKLAYALRPLWDGDAVRVKDRSDVATFLGPARTQGRHVERALGDEPTVVLAIDFMFWFGYGGVSGDEREVRLARQKAGLALLERFDVPILVGDYPDMRGADPRMLSPRQIPSPDVLAELNRRLRAWSEERPNVRVFPLSDFVSHAKDEGIHVQHDDTDVTLGREVLLQGDSLHATRLGMAVLAGRIRDELGALLPESHPARPRAATLEELAESTGAEALLDDLARDGEPVETGAGRRR